MSPSTLRPPGSTLSPLDGPARSWRSDVGQRLRRLFWLKAIGITAFMWVFFVAYFYLLRHPSRPPIEMPLTALDRAIGFQPGALLPYVSLWVYLGIAPGLLLTVRALLRYGLWAAALCLTGLAIFYFVPTATPAPEHAVDLVRNPGFALLQGIDASGNACPSLHVATAIFSALWLHHLLRRVRAPLALAVTNGVWLALIVYSTLAIKQHVLIDALAGALLGLVFALASLHGRRRDEWLG